MATTQLPIEGVFDRDTGRMVGFAADSGEEINLDVGAAQELVAGAGIAAVLSFSWLVVNGDWTNAFQAAYASLPSDGGKIIIHAGEFTVAEKALMVKKSNVHIVGQGRGVTILKTKAKPDGNQTAPIWFGHYSDPSVRGTVSNCSLKYLTINGNFENQYQGTTVNDGQCSGVRIEDVDGLLLMDVEAHHCDGYGFSFVGSNLPHRRNVRFVRLYSHDNAYDGFDIKAGAQGVRLHQCVSDDNGLIGTIPGRDSMGFDLRGEDVIATECQASGSVSGNFRIRENAGLGIRLVNCTSRNAPSTGYGFHLIGGNMGINSLVGCVSYGDGTAFRYRRGHAKLVNCMAYKPTSYGFHLEEDAPATMATTTGTVAMTVGVVAVIPVDASTNVAVGEFVRVSDGTAYVEGVIDEVNGSSLSVYVMSNQGTGPVGVGAAVTVRNIGSVTMIGCHATRAGIDGITIQSMPFEVKLVDCESMFNIRYGMNCNATNIRLVRTKMNNNVRGINFTSMSATNWLYIDDSEFTDDQTDKRQTHAFVWDAGSNACVGAVTRSLLAGNLTAVNSGTVPAGIAFRKNTGFSTPDFGTTANRPVLNSLADVNFQYYDTTIGKPVWWSGTAWKDANGATV